MNKYKSIKFLLITLVLTGCTSTKNSFQKPGARSTIASYTETQLSADDKVQKLFDTIFEERVALSPEWQTSLGRSTQKDRWNEHTEEAYQAWHDQAKAHLQQLQRLDSRQLNHQNQLSLSLLMADLEEEISNHPWRYHGYPINQMFGYHSRVPSFLMSQHSIKTLQDAEDYIARLNGVKTKLAQVVEFLQERKQRGIIAPKFVFAHVLRDSDNLLQGRPFEASSENDSTLLVDFKRKIDKLDIDEQTKGRLISEANTALKTNVLQGYRALIAELKTLEEFAPEQIGVWQQPDGDRYYQTRLEQMTTTDLSAEAIHQLGLSEVARIHSQMRKIIDDLEFNGSLQEFFEHLRTNPKFTYPNTDAGKERYLSETQALIANMKKALPTVFNVMPKADLIVQPVEPFREKSAGKAFYQWPSPDGDRPGIYYINLYDMNNMPWYQMEALAYHEALPRYGDFWCMTN